MKNEICKKDQLKLYRSDSADYVKMKPTFLKAFGETVYSVSQYGILPVEEVENAIKSNSWWLPTNYNDNVVKSINRSIVNILCNTDNCYKKCYICKNSFDL